MKGFGTAWLWFNGVTFDRNLPEWSEKLTIKKILIRIACVPIEFQTEKLQNASLCHCQYNDQIDNEKQTK
jgi:hypothetical protein